MPKNKNKDIQTTYDRHIQKMSPERKRQFDLGYKELLISEMLHAALQKDAVSIQKLAQAIGISAPVLKEFMSDKHTDVPLSTFNRVLNTIGYQLSVEPIRD